MQKELGHVHGQVETVNKQITEMHAEQVRLQKQLDVLAPSMTKSYFRNAPLSDFMAPTLKIQQVILPEHRRRREDFIRVPKMDRCQTCHLAIDKKGFESTQPFTTTPDLVDVSGRRIAAPDRSGWLHGVS